MEKGCVKPRKTLTLDKRIEVIKTVGKKMMSMPQAARMFECSLSQIKNIMRRKHEYLHEWNNNGDLTEIKRKQALCFLSVGAIVCEFAHRWQALGFEITDDLLFMKGQEVAALLNTTEVKTTSYWLERIKKKFKIYDLPACTTSNSLLMADIIMGLVDNYSPDSRAPQLIDYKTIRNYLIEPSSVSIASGAKKSKLVANECYVLSSSSEASNDAVNPHNSVDRPLKSQVKKNSDGKKKQVVVQQEVILEGTIDITDMDDDDDDALLIDECPIPAENDYTHETEMCVSRVNTYEEALSYLGPLEQFLLLQEDMRAIGLLNQLENAFKDKINQSQ